VSAQSDEEFREFMLGRWPAMVRLAYGLTGDLGHAEDVAQAAFARAYASWSRVARTGNPEAYVRRIVINENNSRFRRRRVTERLVDAVPEPAGPRSDNTADVADALGDSEALMRALRRLGPRQRAVVVLRFWMDMSEAETAAALDCSVGTVKSQASRALAALRGSAELMEGELQ
jgi:RNA polymerase sigma-70 factor (sigma-E family)